MTPLPPFVETLVSRGRAPLGPPVPVDFGVSDGPLAELARVLARVNGFTAFNGGVQLLRAGAAGVGPELAHWNRPDTWKDTYGGLAQGAFCFGQDVLGTQFAVVGRERVVAFDPETAARTEIGDSLDAWAEWLLDDPDVNGTRRLATAWQDANGPLAHGERLLPLRFFVLGGSYDLANLVVRDAARCMRVRGPLAARLSRLPQGATVRFDAG